MNHIIFIEVPCRSDSFLELFDTTPPLLYLILPFTAVNSKLIKLWSSEIYFVSHSIFISVTNYTALLKNTVWTPGIQFVHTVDLISVFRGFHSHSCRLTNSFFNKLSAPASLASAFAFFVSSLPNSFSAVSLYFRIYIIQRKVLTFSTYYP